MPTFQHLREFFDMKACLNDRGRFIVLPHWQALWNAWGRGDLIDTVLLRTPVNETEHQRTDRLYRFLHFVNWQYESAGLKVNPELPRLCTEPYSGTIEQKIRRHFSAFHIDDMVAPKTFDRHPQLAIMASGGIDFIIALAWAHQVLSYEPADIAVVYVDYGTEHANKTNLLLGRSKEWVQRHATWVFRFVAKPPNNGPAQDIQKLPGQKKIYRNAFLASIGSLLAPNVWVLTGASQDQRHEIASKSTRFFADISSILAQQHGRPVQVNSPFRHLSKPELYGWFVRQFGDEAYTLFSNASDCDDKVAIACGECHSCYKAALTLALMGDERLAGLCRTRYPEIQDNKGFRHYLQRHVSTEDRRTIECFFWPNENKTVPQEYQDGTT